MFLEEGGGGGTSLLILALGVDLLLLPVSRYLFQSSQLIKDQTLTLSFLGEREKRKERERDWERERASSPQDPYCGGQGEIWEHYFVFVVAMILHFHLH